MCEGSEIFHVKALAQDLVYSRYSKVGATDIKK